MKSFIILLTLLTLTTSTQEINLQSKPLDIIKCLLQSEILINDLNKIIEIIKRRLYKINIKNNRNLSKCI